MNRNRRSSPSVVCTTDRCTRPRDTAKSIHRGDVLFTWTPGIPGDAATSSISAPTSDLTFASSTRSAACAISASPTQMFGLNTALRPSAAATSRTRRSARDDAASSAAGSPCPVARLDRGISLKGFRDVTRRISSAASFTALGSLIARSLLQPGNSAGGGMTASTEASVRWPSRLSFTQPSCSRVGRTSFSSSKRVSLASMPIARTRWLDERPEPRSRHAISYTLPAYSSSPSAARAWLTWKADICRHSPSSSSASSSTLPPSQLRPSGGIRHSARSV